MSASQGATEIVATYNKFMKEYVAAYNNGDPNNRDFNALGGGNAAGLQDVIQTAVDAGVVATGNPAWSPHPVVQFVDANKTIASVTFCFDPASWKTVAAATVGSATSSPDGTPSPQETTPPSPSDASGHPPRPWYPTDAIGKYTVLMLMNQHTAGKWTVAQVNAQPDRPCHLS